MIISNKSKHNFWSRLLLSMLAIFVLPATQELNYPAAVGNENYQNTQQQNAPQILTAVSLLQQNRQLKFSPKTNRTLRVRRLFLLRQFVPDRHWFNLDYLIYAIV